jgi:pimeloyl-ACP methyl ester carboxylesterase
MSEQLEKKRLRISAGEISYVDEGDPENPAIVFLHGFPTSSYLWREFVPLCAPWMRAIAPDLLGYGDSDRPVGAELHIRAQAGFMRELLDSLGVREFAVVGHATGGGIAQLLALGGGVKAMVLVDSIAFDRWPSDPMRELMRQAPAQPTGSQVRAVMRTIFDLGMGRRSRMTEEIFEQYARPFEGDDGPAAFLRLALAHDGVGLVGIEPRLERLECPALLLWGEDDPFQSVEVAERLAEALPMSTLAVLPGCSHFVTEDAPETVLPLVHQYLRSHYLGVQHEHEHEHAQEGGIVRLDLLRGPPTEGEDLT